METVSKETVRNRDIQGLAHEARARMVMQKILGIV